MMFRCDNCDRVFCTHSGGFVCEKCEKSFCDKCERVHLSDREDALLCRACAGETSPPKVDLATWIYDFATGLVRAQAEFYRRRP